MVMGGIGLHDGCHPGEGGGGNCIDTTGPPSSTRPQCRRSIGNSIFREAPVVSRGFVTKKTSFSLRRRQVSARPGSPDPPSLPPRLIGNGGLNVDDRICGGGNESWVFRGLGAHLQIIN